VVPGAGEVQGEHCQHQAGAERPGEQQPSGAGAAEHGGGALARFGAEQPGQPEQQPSAANSTSSTAPVMAVSRPLPSAPPVRRARWRAPVLVAGRDWLMAAAL